MLGSGGSRGPNLIAVVTGRVQSLRIDPGRLTRPNSVQSTVSGTGKPRDIYPLVAAKLPELSEEELNQRLENFPSTRKAAYIAS